MIKPICFKCREELNENGAILLSPPTNYYLPTEPQLSYDRIFKFHLCRACYTLVFNLINQYGNSTDRTTEKR